MGAILLIAALIAAYIICYWSVMIEISGDKTLGLLGLKKSAGESLHKLRQVQKNYFRPKASEEKEETKPIPVPKHPYLRQK